MTEYTIAGETAADLSDIEQLHAVSFGPGRFARAAFRLREQGGHDPALSFVARRLAAPFLLGSVRLTWIGSAQDEPLGLLLGPLAVMPDWKGRGVGRALMNHAIRHAANSDARYVLLVGDLGYYETFGFCRVPDNHLSMPGPVDPNRLLMLPLKDDLQHSPRGMVCHASRVIRR